LLGRQEGANIFTISRGGVGRTLHGNKWDRLGNVDLVPLSEKNNNGGGKGKRKFIFHDLKNLDYLRELRGTARERGSGTKDKKTFFDLSLLRVSNLLKGKKALRGPQISED